MNNELNDAESESVDIIEVLETIHDSESNDLDAKYEILELERKILKFEEQKKHEERALKGKKVDLAIKQLSSRISKFLKVIEEVNPA